VGRHGHKKMACVADDSKASGASGGGEQRGGCFGESVGSPYVVLKTVLLKFSCSGTIACPTPRALHWARQLKVLEKLRYRSSRVLQTFTESCKTIAGPDSTLGRTQKTKRTQSKAYIQTGRRKTAACRMSESDRESCSAAHRILKN